MSGGSFFFVALTSYFLDENQTVKIKPAGFNTDLFIKIWNQTTSQKIPPAIGDY